jgi:16S rRNA (adenine1518-N6/adenine1519-N6)-dimethyltransferase
VYLKNHFPKLEDRILNEDFLSYPLEQFSTEKIAIIGNFPYNISSQIFFRVLDYRDQVTEVVCMLQKEVAERLTGKPGGREYGILTILLQAFYHTEYLFTVHEDVFNPPPKVKSGVIRITRNESAQLDCDELLFKKIIKTAFGQRRKTMRNTLKTFVNYAKIPAETLSRRPEELSVDEFVTLTKILM